MHQQHFYNFYARQQEDVHLLAYESMQDQVDYQLVHQGNQQIIHNKLFEKEIVILL
jgi:hypothetical protein